MTTDERISKWLSAIPGAVSGQGGHNQTYSVACALVNGWALDGASALSWLTQYNSKCQPPWTEKELKHKIDQASTSSHTKPRGHLLGSRHTPTARSVRSEYIPTPEPPALSPKCSYTVDAPTSLPPAKPDPARQFLLAAFKPGEFLSLIHI